MLISNTKSLNRLIVIVLTIAVLGPLSVSAQTARSPVAPRRELVEQVVREAYEKFKTDSSGKNADYIPISPKSTRSYLGSQSSLPTIRS